MVILFRVLVTLHEVLKSSLHWELSEWWLLFIFNSEDTRLRSQQYFQIKCLILYIPRVLYVAIFLPLYGCNRRPLNLLHQKHLLLLVTGRIGRDLLEYSFVVSAIFLDFTPSNTGKKSACAYFFHTR